MPKKDDKKCSKPEWAQKFDGWCSEYSETNSDKHGRAGHFIGHIFAIGFIVLFFYLLNRYWDKIPVLTGDFKVVLWVFNISLAFAALSNLLQAIIPSRAFEHFLKLIENGIAFVVFYTAYIIFPFTFSGIHAEIARVVMVIIMIGIGIGVIVEFFKMIGRRG